MQAQSEAAGGGSDAQGTLAEGAALRGAQPLRFWGHVDFTHQKRGLLRLEQTDCSVYT